MKNIMNGVTWGIIGFLAVMLSGAVYARNNEGNQVPSAVISSNPDIILTDDEAGEQNEAQISPGALPAPVVQSIKKQYPQGKITAAEKQTTAKGTIYEVDVTENNKRYDVMVDPSGKIVKAAPEEPGEKEEPGESGESK